jgi:hypothetical protein
MRREAQNEKDRDGENDNSLTDRNRVPMITTYFSSVSAAPLKALRGSLYPDKILALTLKTTQIAHRSR